MLVAGCGNWGASECSLQKPAGICELAPAEAEHLQGSMSATSNQSVILGNISFTHISTIMWHPFLITNLGPSKVCSSKQDTGIHSRVEHTGKSCWQMFSLSMSIRKVDHVSHLSTEVKGKNNKQHVTQLIFVVVLLRWIQFWLATSV